MLYLGWDLHGNFNTKPLRNTMVIATFLIYVPLYLLIAPYMGIHAIWIAMIIFMLARGILLSIMAHHYFSIKSN